jgi:hypothetical protein
MPGRDNSYEALARSAAGRLEQARAQGEQLKLLADAEPEAVTEARAVRGKGKAMSQMREWLAARGYRRPEEVLAQIAGLDSRDDVILACMADAERIVAWAHADKRDADGSVVMPSASAFVRAFEMVYTMRMRALDALMPYVAPKVTPDAATLPVVPIMVPVAPSAGRDPALEARDVTPQPVRIGGRMIPANLRREMQQNQQVADAVPSQSDAASRTDEASR